MSQKENNMKYTSNEVNRMSWQEWNQTMAEELNKKGFKAKEFDGSKWTKTGQYKANDDDPKLFVLGTIEDGAAISYLRDIGLLSNGRCPMCGEPINGNPGRFTSGYDPDFYFQICQNCVKTRGGMRSAPSQSGSGCLVALLLFPWHLIKHLFF